MNRKIFAIVLSLCIGLNLTVWASSPMLIVSTVTSKSEEVVEIDISIKNNPGMAVFVFRLEYDNSLLTPQSINKGAILTEGSILSNLDDEKNPENLKDLSVIWMNAGDMTSDGVLFTIQFQIKDSTVDIIPITLSYERGNLLNEDAEDLFMDILSGGIMIEKDIAPLPSDPPVDVGDVLEIDDDITEDDGSSKDVADNDDENVIIGNGDKQTQDLPEDTVDSENYLSENGAKEKETSDKIETNISDSAPKTDDSNYALEPLAITEVKRFSDLTEVSWAETAIYNLASLGIIKGVSETSFEPQKNITRGDYIVLLMRMMNLTAEFDGNFEDVESDRYYYNEIGTAKALGFIKGVDDNRFAPEETITRQDMFVMAHRILVNQQYFSKTAADYSVDFTDEDLVSDYAQEAISSLVAAKLVEGSNGMIYPMENATRAETAVFLNRIKQLYNF